MASGYTHLNLSEVEDSAARYGFGETQESRFANEDLEAEQTGLSHHRIKPGRRQPFGHRHEGAEEVYVVIRGSGRAKLDDEIVEIRERDAIRVSPGVVRAFEAGAEGLEIIACGAPAARRPGRGHPGLVERLSGPARTIGVAERRVRLARRHRLAPGDRAGDVVEAASSMVCLHATDPATVYLSAWARVGAMAVSELERALCSDRSLVKHLAMRRTLFVFPRAILGLAQAGASNRVAAAERRRLIRDVEKAGLHRDGERWLSEAGREVLAVLSDGREATSSELRDEVPLLEGSIAYGEGKPWGGQVPIGPRVLTTLSAAGEIVRASNDGGWTTSRPRWAAMTCWLGEELAPPPEPEGVAGLVERWLRVFGPGTAGDIKWWLGSTVTAVRRALADLHAVEVDLDGQIGYLLPDDLEATDPVEPWGGLLPPLDPTTMGWLERDWYLGPHKEQLFDRNGNAGPTAWWDGRIVGGWRQSDAGEVVLQLLEDIGADARRALEHEAERLTQWLGGTRVLARFPSPLSQAPAE